MNDVGPDPPRFCGISQETSAASLGSGKTDQ